MITVNALQWHGQTQTSLQADSYTIYKTYGLAPKEFMLSRGSNLLGYSDSIEELKQLAETHNQQVILSAITISTEERDQYLNKAAQISRSRCPKCDGYGWLWGYELDDYCASVDMPDDTRYPCDGPGCKSANEILDLK